MTRTFLLAVLVSTPSWAGPPTIGYAQSTGYFKKDTRPTLYQPLNLLDGREATAWCSTSSDVLNETLTIGFKGNAKIDEIRVYTGNGFDGNTFQEFSRAKKFSIKGPTSASSFTVNDERGQQSVGLNPPIYGPQFTIEILDQYPAEDLDAPVCVTDLVFMSDGKPLNGPWLTQKLKYDKNRAQLIGTWFGGYEGAADRYLSFFFDGTYRFVYEPFDGQERAKTFTGDYEVAGTRLTLELPGKGKVGLRFKKDKPENAQKAVKVLTLSGDVPDDLKHPFRDHL